MKSTFRLGIFLLVGAGVLLHAQTTAAGPADAQAGSIGGQVRNAATLEPLPGSNVFLRQLAKFVEGRLMSTRGETVQQSSDEQGRYTFRDLQPGQYRVELLGREFNVSAPRVMLLRAGESNSSVDLLVKPAATIRGVVRDQHGEPVGDAFVHLVARYYSLGEPRYFLRGRARADDAGEYTLEGVTPGLPYTVFARVERSGLKAISDAPLDGKKRRPVYTPTYYPNVETAEGATVLTLAPGEERAGVDITMQRGPSFCAAGKVNAAPGTEGAYLAFTEPEPTYGVVADSGVIGPPRFVQLGDDQRFRICDLSAVDYLVSVHTGIFKKGQVAYNELPLRMADRDVSGLDIPLQIPYSIDGEVEWDGEAPKDPPDVEVRVGLWALFRGGYGAKETRSGRTSLPGAFKLGSVLASDYQVRAFVTEPGLYVKDILYGDESVLHKPMRVGGAVGEPKVRVIVSRDGGSLQASLVDKEGQPVPDAQLLLVPTSVSNEAEFATHWRLERADQYGQVTVGGVLPPGEYWAFGLTEAPQPMPEPVSRLWRVRGDAEKITVKPGQMVQVRVEVSTE